MEVAGVVLGAIPIVIAALQCYKDTIKLGGRLFKRKKHVEKLIRALTEQKGALEQNLEWLSKAIDEPCDRVEELDLENEHVRDAMMGYLGSSGLTSFALALTSAQTTVSNIIRNIKGLLPDKTVSMTLSSQVLHVKSRCSYTSMMPYCFDTCTITYPATWALRINSLKSLDNKNVWLTRPRASRRRVEQDYRVKRFWKLQRPISKRVQAHASRRYR